MCQCSGILVDSAGLENPNCNSPSLAGRLALVLDVTKLLPDVVVDDLVVRRHVVDELEELFPQLVGFDLEELGVFGDGLDDVRAVHEALVLIELDQQPLLVPR